MQKFLTDLLNDWHIHPYVWNLIIIAAAILIGLFIWLLLSLFVRKETNTVSKFYLMHSLLRHLSTPLSVFIPLFILDIFLPIMRTSNDMRNRMNHAIEVALIVTFSWALIQFIKVIQEIVHRKVNIQQTDNLRQRRLITQLMYIRRVSTTIIILLTIGAVLLTFDTMQKLGTGLLTGVGIGGIIIGFAAQRSLGNLLAGFQIAFTQPIRIDDEVIVEDEFGWIEEITLTYVVVRIWDNRRLVLPINYFIEKPFQNWTRKTADITGSIYLYSDYRLPIDWLRNEFMKFIENNPLWDKKSAGLVVTALKENVMEIRGTISSRSSGDSWDLRCLLREHLTKRINEVYPDCLPTIRAELIHPLPHKEE